MTKGSIHESFHSYVQQNSVAALKPDWLGLGAEALGRALKQHLGSLPAESSLVVRRCVMKNPFGSLLGHEGAVGLRADGYRLLSGEADGKIWMQCRNLDRDDAHDLVQVKKELLLQNLVPVKQEALEDQDGESEDGEEEFEEGEEEVQDGEEEVEEEEDEDVDVDDMEVDYNPEDVI